MFDIELLLVCAFIKVYENVCVCVFTAFCMLLVEARSKVYSNVIRVLISLTMILCCVLAKFLNESKYIYDTVCSFWCRITLTGNA